MKPTRCSCGKMPEIVYIKCEHDYRKEISCCGKKVWSFSEIEVIVRWREENDGWVSVNKPMPKDGTECLMLNDHGILRGYYNIETDQCYESWNDDPFYHTFEVYHNSTHKLSDSYATPVTHWRDLPDLPKENPTND